MNSQNSKRDIHPFYDRRDEPVSDIPWKRAGAKRPQSWFSDREKGTFGDRLALADRFEATFIREFNDRMDDLRIVKQGIESGGLYSYHGHLRFRRDPTTLLLRYMPDSVLIDLRKHNPIESMMLEFKAGNSGIYSQNLFNNLQRKSQSAPVPLERIEDVFNIERDAYEQYMKLAAHGSHVVILVYAGFREPGDRLFAQYVDRISTCGDYNPNQLGKNTGSGTHSVNINLASMVRAECFFKEVAEVNQRVITDIEYMIEA